MMPPKKEDEESVLKYKSSKKGNDLGKDAWMLP